jgi:hypothetical protein
MGWRSRRLSVWSSLTDSWKKDLCSWGLQLGLASRGAIALALRDMMFSLTPGISVEVVQVDEIPADVDLVLVMGQQLLGRMRIELDLIAPALGIPFPEPGQDQEAVLLDEVAARVEEHGIDGQVLNDIFPEVFEERFLAGDEFRHRVVGSGRHHGIGRGQQEEDGARPELQVEVLEGILVKVVEEHGPQGRQVPGIQL